MYYFQTAIKDSTLYKGQREQNTGLDEILEISKTYYGDSLEISRPLIKFDIEKTKSFLDSLSLTINSAFLVLKEAESSEIPSEYTITANPVNGSWDMGIGTKFDDISTDGVTWRQRKNGEYWASSGGDIHTGDETSHILQYLGSDLEMDVKPIVDGWIANRYNNEGFLLSFTSSMEDDSNEYGVLQYFSKETNTIYQPKLRISVDDSEFNTGDLTELVSDDIQIKFKNLKSTYKVDTTVNIKIVGREKYPMKTYTKQYGYTDIQFLPKTTYYQIKDSITHEIVAPYGAGSTVSCNSVGNYFKLNLHNWEIGRDYYIEIKTTIGGSEMIISDPSITFTVEK